MGVSVWWSVALTVVGCAGFLLAGRKVWWAWWVNVACQGIWVAYAIVSQQWGFLFSVPIYLSVFVPNAVRWTREHRAEKRRWKGEPLPGPLATLGPPLDVTHGWGDQTPCGWPMSETLAKHSTMDHREVTCPACIAALTERP